MFPHSKRELSQITNAQSAEHLALRLLIDRNITQQKWFESVACPKPKNIVNVANEDPSEARGDLAYDPFPHNPFGRLIKVGVTYNLPG